MREWDAFCQLIALFIATGYVKGGSAASALFVGPPGAGKSTALLRFTQVKTCHAISDLTVEPLRSVILPDVQNRGLRHLLFPDFWKLFQRKDYSVGNVVGLLAAGMSGEFQTAYIGKDTHHWAGIQFGILGAMPEMIYNRWHGDLSSQGLLDRMIVFPWNFTRPERERIEGFVANGDRRDMGPYPFPEIPGPVPVQWNPKLTPWLGEFVDSIKKEHRNRLIGTLRSLMLGAAVLRQRPQVTRDELDLLAGYGPYFRVAVV